jgi:hypothetical protein
MEELKKVRLFGDWDKQGPELVGQLAMQTGYMNPPFYKNIEFTWGEDYTHAVVFNFPAQNINVPPENVIGLLLEPPEILNVMYPGKAIRGKYPQVSKYFSFAQQTGFGWAPFIGFGTVPDAGYPRQGDEFKSNRMCMIVSDKRITPYHAVRHQLFQTLLKTDMPIDFYGRGLKLSDDPRIKGEIPPMNKQSVLSRYEIVMDFENTKYGGLTDKYFDAIMCNCVPVTNCREIHESDIFNIVGSPSEFISFEDPVDMMVDKIKAIYNDCDTYKKTRSIEIARMEILHGRMSIANWIHKALI